MADQEQTVGIAAPSLPKGGGAIQSIGKGWGAVGTTGAASLEIPLPITAGRGYAPPLMLSYQSSAGNGLFGLGWNLNLGCVARRASKGVPLYTDDDVILGPGGEIWLPERDAQGVIQYTTVSAYNGLTLDASYQVIRYFASVEGAFERIEHWRQDEADPGFWLVHGADGSLAFYGRNPGSRSTDPADSNHVAEWLLEETMNAHGEHILYEYKAEDNDGLPADHPRDFIAQCYLWRVRYGNFKAHAHLYLWQPDQLPSLQWHFDLLFDYGERSDREEGPGYEEDVPWKVRADAHSSFAYGFELGNLRFVHKVLMFHYVPDELGTMPVLVAGLTLNYLDLEQRYKVLSSVQSFGCSPSMTQPVEYRPPVDFHYQDFTSTGGRFTVFDAMPGLDDGQRYQLVDLYGEGLPGMLYHDDRGWLYREPLRDTDKGEDAVLYGPWQLLPTIPVADSRTGVRQSLADLTGDGRLDWIMAQPGMAGFFTLNPDRTWSTFAPFAAFPAEFFHPQGQLADLVGDGLADLALIGPRSVRLYASRRAGGFAPASEIAHDADGDRLPLLSDSPSELVAFTDILGTGQQHLVRIRHDEVRFWPNLGRGRFGEGKRFASLPFSYGEFDASRIRLADLDGSGAADLLYLEPDGFRVFMNQSGNGFATPVLKTWPDDVRYDRFCQVSLADLNGLGCSSLVLTVPHMKPAHWRFDFSPVKPYLLDETNNHMGAIASVGYRSSAQEWLDEKAELLDAGLPAVSLLPFPLHVVVWQTQLDEVTGNLLTQRMRYRHGYYDGHEREFRGFGLVLQTDTEIQGDEPEGFTAPVLSKTWFHTGCQATSLHLDFNACDQGAVDLGADLLTTYVSGRDHVIENADEVDQREMARVLSGSVRRVEVFGLDGEIPHAVPYSVQASRHLVRRLEAAGPHQPYARMMPQVLESIAYQYEGQADDPMCQHAINLTWDAYGVLTHGVSVNYARRKTSADTPPFDDEHQQRWWQAAHDEAQQRYYLSEAKAEAIHLEAAQTWRLGLPYLSRTNAMMIEASAIGPERISYEQLSDPAGWFAVLPRTLVSLARQRYVNAGDGEGTFEALPDAVEIAELDDHALTAYDRLYEPPFSMTPEQLLARLVEVGYQRMTSFLPADPPLNLWSVRRGFNTYADADDFYRVEAFRPTSSHGLSTVAYDPYNLMVTSVTAPDGCTTSASYDYHCLQPRQVVDPNQNTQEALYDGFGVLRMTSFYGTELGEAVGFDPLAEVTVAPLTPTEAITTTVAANYATAHYYDAFSWQDHAQPVHSIALQWDRYPDDPDRQQRMVLTSVDGFGRVLQTRQKVESGTAYEVVEGRLRDVASQLPEVTTEAVVSLMSIDGFSDIVLPLRKVGSDEADHVVDQWLSETGLGWRGFNARLIVKMMSLQGFWSVVKRVQAIQANVVDQSERAWVEPRSKTERLEEAIGAWLGGLLEVDAEDRWRVSESVEYNNKGLPIRIYRPYFTNTHEYVDDRSVRALRYHDKQFYDPLGRPTETWTAKGWLRRTTYLTWYTISEDENDTAEEVNARRAAAGLPLLDDGSQAGKRKKNPFGF
ncbi:SpvB/TcaC N-terminal domain-containing protein [Pseudomonas abietaniphila]|uniref:SpvB/TcaC N-terminal domain-containing protein n=1 Tax=Pseudomonas abietaniphila TaxID=89065 RepID=UPI000783C112|nr:SpvB/TcaC N-terminal domain-containing protein [Pseudomonas abietaniphila]